MDWRFLARPSSQQRDMLYPNGRPGEHDTMFTQVVGAQLHAAMAAFGKRIDGKMALYGPGTFRNPDGLRRTGKNYERRTSYGMLSIIVAAIDEHPTKYIHAATLDGTHYLGRPFRLNISKQVGGSGQTGTVVVSDGSHGSPVPLQHWPVDDTKASSAPRRRSWLLRSVRLHSRCRQRHARLSGGHGRAVKRRQSF